MSFRKFVYANLVAATLVLGLNDFVVVARPSRHVTLWGVSLEFLVAPIVLVQIVLPPVQTALAIGLLLFKSEARSRPTVWLLLLLMAVSFLSGILVLMGIGQAGGP